MLFKAFALALAVAAVDANPISISFPEVTPAPSRAEVASKLEARDASVTTIPVSSCVVFQDPDGSAGGSSGCYCSGYDPLLPMTSDGTNLCDYSQVVTVAGGSTNPWIFTTTESNQAIVAYDQTTVYPGGSQVYGAGDSTVLQGGTSITLQMNPSSSVNVGYMTESSQTASVYSAVSNNIVAACGTPTSGQTITTCSSVAEVTNVAYINGYNDLHEDGKLEISVDIASISDATVLQALAGTIANGIVGNAASNVHLTEYECDSCWQDIDWPSKNISMAPNHYLASYTEQTAETNGDIKLQDLEVTFVMEAGKGDLECSTAGLVLSGMAALGAAIPGLSFLSFGVVGSELRFGLSLVCNLDK